MQSSPGKTTWIAIASIFKDQLGMGASFAHRFDANGVLAVTGAIGWGGKDNLVVRAGLQGEM
jgi:hypothetical protein